MADVIDLKQYRTNKERKRRDELVRLVADALRYVARRVDKAGGEFPKRRAVWVEPNE